MLIARYQSSLLCKASPGISQVLFNQNIEQKLPGEKDASELAVKAIKRSAVVPAIHPNAHCAFFTPRKAQYLLYEISGLSVGSLYI